MIARAFAAIYEIDVDEYMATITCESGWDPSIQSNHTQDYGREQSWGLVQIHLPAHPSITKEQALDPIWSLEWMAQHFAAGNQSMWSCWKLAQR